MTEKANQKCLYCLCCPRSLLEPGFRTDKEGNMHVENRHWIQTHPECSWERIWFLGKKAGSICTCLLLPHVLPGWDQVWAHLGAFFWATKPLQRDILFSWVSQTFRHLFQTEEPNVRNVIYFLVCKKSTDKRQALLSTLLMLCLCRLTMVHTESKANCISTGVQQEAYWSWAWKAELTGLSACCNCLCQSVHYYELEIFTPSHTQGLDWESFILQSYWNY